MRIFLVIIVFVLAFALTGCSQSLEAVEPLPVARIGASVNGTLAEGYPQGVPLWEGALVLASDRVMRHDFSVYDLTLQSDDPLKTVLDGYLIALQREGFNVTQRDIDSTMMSVIATTTAYDATFTFTTNSARKTEIVTSILIHPNR